jgi:hypothetical protein
MNFAPVFQWTTETASKLQAKPKKHTPNLEFRHIFDTQVALLRFRRGEKDYFGCGEAW